MNLSWPSRSRPPQRGSLTTDHRGVCFRPCNELSRSRLLPWCFSRSVFRHFEHSPTRSSHREPTGCSCPQGRFSWGQTGWVSKTNTHDTVALSGRSTSTARRSHGPSMTAVWQRECAHRNAHSERGFVTGDSPSWVLIGTRPKRTAVGRAEDFRPRLSGRKPHAAQTEEHIRGERLIPITI